MILALLAVLAISILEFNLPAVPPGVRFSSPGEMRSYSAGGIEEAQNAVPPDGAVDPPDLSSRVIVRIRDIVGDPLTGIDVEIRENPHLSLSGFFELPLGEQEGAWSLSAEQPPRRTFHPVLDADGAFPLEARARAFLGVRDHLVLRAHSEVTLEGKRIDLAVTPARELHGVVLDAASEEHLAGVDVALEAGSIPVRLGGRETLVIPAWRTSTGADGRFRLTVPAELPAALRFELALYETTFQRGYPGEDLRVLLRRRIRATDVVVRGRVVDTAGRGVPEAHVSGGGRFTRSDGRGAFELASPQLGPQAAIVAFHRTAGRSHELVLGQVGALGPDGVWSIELVVEPGAALTGTVFDAEGRALEGAVVELAEGTALGGSATWALETMRPGGSRGDVRTRADGRFAFYHLVPGRHTVRIALEPPLRVVRLDLEAPGKHEVRLPPAGAVLRVEGRVVDRASRPVAGLSVGVTVGGDMARGQIGLSAKSVVTGVEGRFAFEVVPDPEMAVLVSQALAGGSGHALILRRERLDDLAPHVELRVDPWCGLRLDVPRGARGALEVVDAQGAALTYFVLEGGTLMADRRHSLGSFDGRSPAWVPSSARWLRVLAGGELVAEQPVDPRIGETVEAAIDLP